MTGTSKLGLLLRSSPAELPQGCRLIACAGCRCVDVQAATGPDMDVVYLTCVACNKPVGSIRATIVEQIKEKER